MSLLQKPIVRTALVAAALFAVTFAIAAALEISGVDYLAEGDSPVESGTSVTDVSWVLEKQGNKWKVIGVTLTFEGKLPAGTFVAVDLYSGDPDNVIASGETTLQDPDDEFTIDTSPDVLPKDIDGIRVTVSIPA